jgi:hypothetical protein
VQPIIAPTKIVPRLNLNVATAAFTHASLTPPNLLSLADVMVTCEAKDLTDAIAFKTKVIGMQELILESQTGAIEACQKHSAQVKHICEPEAEVTRLETWDGEKQRYEMKVQWTGAAVYALR